MDIKRVQPGLPIIIKSIMNTTAEGWCSSDSNKYINCKGSIIEQHNTVQQAIKVSFEYREEQHSRYFHHKDLYAIGDNKNLKNEKYQFNVNNLVGV